MDLTWTNAFIVKAKPRIAGISYADGGFVCKEDLQDGVEACDPRKLKILRYAFRCKVERFSPCFSFGKDECQDLLRGNFPNTQTTSLG
jgi:hypothetical protein